MLEQSAFLETLRAVAELRRTSAEPLPKEELLKYFDDMELTEEQTEMVYQYLLLPPEVQTAEPEPEEEEEQTAPLAEDEEEENIYFQMYLDDLAEIEELSDEELEAAYEKLLAGDVSVIGRISESWLRSIAELGSVYAAQGANLEDVIQEGNMGLLMKLSELAGAGEAENVTDMLSEAVKEAMNAFAEENMESHVAELVVKEQEKKNNDQI